MGPVEVKGFELGLALTGRSDASLEHIHSCNAAIGLDNLPNRSSIVTAVSRGAEAIQAQLDNYPLRFE